MGSALPKGGPAGLFLGFVIWAGVMWAVNECFAEMVSYLPVPSPFIRFGGEWVDGALGFAMAWNFFLNMVRDREGSTKDLWDPELTWTVAGHLGTFRNRW